jgi:hypothetical protein
MKQVLTFTFITFIIFSGWSQKKQQHRNHKEDGKRMLYAYWGYNRSMYTKSNIRFFGKGYDFTMAEARAHDNPAKLSWDYINPVKITIPQFNIRMGYYFKDNWAVSLGYDHMKYIFADNNQVKLSGHVDPGVDNVTSLSGDYNNVIYVTDRTKFHYENSDGLNYIRAEVMYSKQWYETPGGWFGVSTNFGVSTGGILSYNDFRFAGQNDMRTISLSGYGVSANVQARLEFFQHIFFQFGYGGGFMHQVNVKTRPNDATARARQTFGFMEINGVFGAMFYIKSKNNCNTCPNW